MLISVVLDINISVGCIAVHGKRKKMEVVSIFRCGIDHNAYDTDLITFRQTLRKKPEPYSCFWHKVEVFRLLKCNKIIFLALKEQA